MKNTQTNKIEFKPEQFIIKNKCAKCGESFENNWKRFWLNGNFCWKCSIKIPSGLGKKYAIKQN